MKKEGRISVRGSHYRHRRQPYSPPRQKIVKLDYSTGGYFGRTPENNQGVTIPKWIFLVLGILAALFFIGWFFTQAPWLKVKTIIIDGQATPETEAIVHKLYSKNILWLSVTHPEATIRKNQPSIKQIQILRGIPDTLRVKLIERQPALIWQVGDRWYTLDETGFVFKQETLTKKPDNSYELPVTELPVVIDTKNLPVELGHSIVRPSFIAFIANLKKELEPEAGLTMIRAEIGETTFNASVVTNAGWKILFDTTRPLDVQLRTVKRVLESKRSEIHEYLDVRVRGWVYYK